MKQFKKSRFCITLSKWTLSTDDNDSSICILPYITPLLYNLCSCKHTWIFMVCLFAVSFKNDMTTHSFFLKFTQTVCLNFALMLYTRKIINYYCLVTLDAFYPSVSPNYQFFLKR